MTNLLNFSIGWKDSTEGSMIVYQIKNKLDGRSYVGATRRNIMRRYSTNWNMRLISNPDLRNDILKHGQKSFDLIILRKPKTVESLYKYEKFYIKKIGSLFPNGYNFQTGGSRKEAVVHEETKLRISQTLKKNGVWNKGLYTKSKENPCAWCGKMVRSIKNRGEYKKTCSRECFKKHMSVKCLGYTNNPKGVNGNVKNPRS